MKKTLLTKREIIFVCLMIAVLLGLFISSSMTYHEQEMSPGYRRPNGPGGHVFSKESAPKGALNRFVRTVNHLTAAGASPSRIKGGLA